jgi:hypothetical protein
VKIARVVKKQASRYLFAVVSVLKAVKDGLCPARSRWRQPALLAFTHASNATVVPNLHLLIIDGRISLE